ncbi:SDR family NAD(P)-dependent oxidoreductase [Tsukamurella sp. NPDC003166]|uniref:SDR family NAD(P)-dependent oxidoreductase n=1 Tax=Tsukamurella sp. NPDC003166 TaxID=3154444 RepID=UPI0033BABF63
MSDFEGRVAVITGGAGGMGSEVAARLAAEGARAYAVDLRADDADGVSGVACDITDPGAVRAAGERILQDAGRVDFLVNAAGIVSTTRPVETIGDDEWSRMLGVNLDGAFYWTRAVMPTMKEQGFGKIVNVSSRAGRTLGNFAGAHYAASKAAILGLTRQVALEAAPHGVYVNAIAPGLVRTPMLSGSVADERVEEFRLATPLRKVGTPSDIADLVLFLLSSKSDFITGATVDINGGDLIL